MSTTDNFPKYYLENVSHIIVSRIPAVVDFIRRTTWDFSIAPAVCFPSAYEIKDKIVAGDIRELPLFLPVCVRSIGQWNMKDILLLLDILKSILLRT